MTSPMSFSAAAPDVSDQGGGTLVEADIYVGMGGARGNYYGVAPGTTVPLALRELPVMQSPSAGATGIGPGSSFTWTDPASDAAHMVTLTCGNPRVVVVRFITAARSAVVPDLSGYGLVWPSGAACTWELRSSAPTGVDGFLTRPPAGTPWYESYTAVRTFTSR